MGSKESKEAFLEVAETRHVDWGGEKINIVDLMVLSGCAKSKSDARRLVEQGAVRVDQSAVKNLNISLSKKEVLLQVGKRQYVRVVPK